MQALADVGFTASDWMKNVAPVIRGVYSGSALFAECSSGDIYRLSDGIEAAKLFAVSSDTFC